MWAEARHVILLSMLFLQAPLDSHDVLARTCPWRHDAMKSRKSKASEVAAGGQQFESLINKETNYITLEFGENDSRI